MITETGTVVAKSQHEIVVEVIKTSACQSCKVRQGCGQAVLAQWGNDTRQMQKNHFQIPYQGELAVGDTVELGMAEESLSQAALLVYLLPLGCGFVGLLVGVQLTANEWLQLLSFLLFSGLSFGLLSRLRVGKSTAFMPRVLRSYSASKISGLITSDKAKSL